MKTITRRVSTLEKQFAPKVDEEGRSVADVIRERRRRRLAAEGKEPEEDPVRENFVVAGNRPQTIAEVIRERRRRRLVAEGRAPEEDAVRARAEADACRGRNDQHKPSIATPWTA